MLEVEVKYRAADPAAVRATLAAWGAAARPVRTDRDHYFAPPDRDFAVTDEAVRLRCTGDANALTYKGPKRDRDTKTREEIELAVEPGPGGAAKALAWLAAVRYRPVGVVEKSREVFALTRAGFHLEACFDDLGPLGRFVELEIVAAEADFERAKAVVLAAAAELGLAERERRSYLAITLGRPEPGVPA